MMGYEAHQLAAMFPDMSKDDYARLLADIDANGLREPIMLFEEKILDGRHRYKACLESGRDPRFSRYDGDDASSFVISENLARRHLTTSQIAMIAMRYETIERERAKERQRASGGANPGKPSGCDDIVTTANDGGRINEVLARKFGIGSTIVTHAQAVKKLGAPELIAKVEAGEITVNEAKKLVSLQKPSQARLANLPSAERKREVSRSIGISKSRKMTAATKGQRFEPAGTEFTRALLGRVELIANDISERGIKDQALTIELFIKEFGWTDDVQLRQLWHCMPVMRMLGELHAVASRRASRLDGAA